MRILTLALAATASLTAAPALAQSGSWYGGVDFGATNVTDIKAAVTGGTIALDTDYGYDSDLFVGYDLGPFRIEAEGAYKKVDVSSLDPSTGASVAGAGSVSITSFMVNAMMDFGDDEQATQFFIGAGVGTGRVRMDSVRAAGSTVNSFDGEDDGMAWQLFAGGRTPINDRTDLKLSYRYFRMNGLDIQAGSTISRDLEVSSHSVLAGIVFNFGPR